MGQFKVKFTTDQFIEKANNKHRGYYDYTLVNYNGSYNYIDIICPVHGKFKQKAYTHLYGIGCNKCGISRTRKTNQQWIEEASNIHNDYYDYSLVNYKRNNGKIIIICPEHGEFKQEAQSHLRGHGCMQCANENKKAKGIYCESYFDTNPNEQGKFYVVKFSNNIESFVKVGITTLSIKERFSSQQQYKLEVIRIENMLLKEAFNKEQKIMKDLKRYSYIPNHKIDGYTECFSLEVLEILENG